jgi:hypothetical protein
MAAVTSQPQLSFPARSLLPEDAAAREWDKLAAIHDLKPLVVTFLKEKIKRLEFLAHIADKELDAFPEHGEWEAKGPMSPLDVALEMSKLRLIRSQIKQQLSALDSGALRQEEALDEVLPSAELCTLQEKFKVVHRFYFTPEQAPSDQTVSRSAREFAKRSLSMRELSKVRTQAETPQTGRTKSAPVGGSSEARLVFGAEEKSSPLGGAPDVLFRIIILLRAHAVAGITPLGDAGDQSQAEEDSTKLRVCPYDIVFRHQCRIERCLKDVPAEMQRAWLLRMFDLEQKYWIEQVRDTKLTIGEIMRNSLEQREALWSQPVIAPPRAQPGSDGRPTQPADRSSPAKQPKAFCIQYNKGSCPRGKRCEHKHRCNRRIDGGVGEPRFCNGPHPAVEHDQVAGKGTKGAGKDKNKGPGKDKKKWQDKWTAKR